MYHLLYLMSLVCLSQASVIIRWSGVNPLVLGGWRLLLAGAVLSLWNQGRHSPARVEVRAQKKIIVAGLAFFIHLYSYAYAAHRTSIAHLMLIFSLNPVITALGSRIFYQEKMSHRQLVSYLLALFGIALLAAETQGTSTLKGDLMALVAAVSFSAYALLSQWARTELSNVVFTSRMYLVSSVFFFSATLGAGQSMVPADFHGWLGVFLLMIFPTLLGHGVFTYVMKFIPLYVLSLGKLIEPPLAAISAFLFFHEKLSSSALFSFGLIGFSVYLLIRDIAKNEQKLGRKF